MFASTQTIVRATTRWLGGGALRRHEFPERESWGRGERCEGAYFLTAEAGGRAVRADAWAVFA